MKKIIHSILSILTFTILFTSCEKYEFEQPVVQPPTLWGEWELYQTTHNYIDVNEVGADTETNWINTDSTTYIALNTSLAFDLVTPYETTWDINEGMFITVDGEEIYEIPRFIYPSENLNPYTQCWDLNGNGYQDPFEDMNGNGVCDVFDCPPPGIVIQVYNTLRVFEVVELTNNTLILQFEGQYFEDFDYYTTSLKFTKIR